ncbi:hypothetical protein PGQ11_000260 [Apiospora arundinis]
MCYEAFFSQTRDDPCPNCVNKDENASHEVNSQSSLGDVVGKTEGGFSCSLRRQAILNCWNQRLDREVEWDPTGAVSETLSHRLLHADTTVQEIARWARMIVNLPKGAFHLGDQLRLTHTWLCCLQGKFPDEDAELLIYRLFVRDGAFDKNEIDSFESFRELVKENGTEKDGKGA